MGSWECILLIKVMKVTWQKKTHVALLHLDMVWEEMWELEDKSGMYLMLDWEAKSGEELTKRNMKRVASTYNRFKSFGRFMMDQKIYRRNEKCFTFAVDPFDYIPSMSIPFLINYSLITGLFSRSITGRP